MSDVPETPSHTIGLARGKWRWTVESEGEIVASWPVRPDRPDKDERFAENPGNECRRPDELQICSGAEEILRLQRRFHWPSGLGAEDEVRIAVRFAEGHECKLALDGRYLNVNEAHDRWLQTGPLGSLENHAGSVHCLEILFDERSGEAAFSGELAIEVELRIFAGRRGKP